MYLGPGIACIRSTKSILTCLIPGNTMLHPIEFGTPGSPLGSVSR